MSLSCDFFVFIKMNKKANFFYILSLTECMRVCVPRAAAAEESSTRTRRRAGISSTSYSYAAWSPGMEGYLAPASSAPARRSA